MCMGGALGEMIGGKASGVGFAKKAGLPALAGGVAGMLLKKRKEKRPVAAAQPAAISMGG